MFPRLIFFLPLLAFFANATAQSSDFYTYIDKFKKIAVKEMQRTGVPASIKLAQALLESGAGKSELARQANNHFGIKCGNDWDGKTYQLEDDDYDDNGNIVKSCFRRYKSAEESFVGHSDFLRDPKRANRYGELFKLETTDYRRWARGLRSAGYATGANYDDKLIRIIETYELYQFDILRNEDFPEGRPNKMEDVLAGLDVRKVNDVKVVFAKNKVTLREISQKSGLSLQKLEKYNDRLPNAEDSLADDTRIYLQPKRCGFRGKQKWHFVTQGETMFAVSQLYGIKLNELYKRNRMPKNSEPQKGERLKIKGWKIKESERPRLLDEPEKQQAPPVVADEDWMMEEVEPENPDGYTSGEVGNPKPTPPITDDEVQPTKPGGNGNSKPTKPGTPTTQPEPSKPKPTTPTTKPDPTTGADPVYHTVAKGDTLYNISKRYGTTVDALSKLNNLSGTNISLGQVLRVK